MCSQLPSHSVCGHSTIVAWCVRVNQQSSSSSLQTTIVGPTKVAWCVPSLSQWNWTGIDRPCLLWIYCIYLLVYLNKTYMKPEVQMRRFIWNINMNPFPHSKTAYGQPTATAPAPSHHRLIDSTDRRQFPRDQGQNSSN